MPTIYLKNGESVQVKLENLEDYLYENADAIATRRKQLRRCKRSRPLGKL